jgi:hypothetical protein
MQARDSRLEVEEGPDEWAPLISEREEMGAYPFGSGGLLGLGRFLAWAS